MMKEHLELKPIGVSLSAPTGFPSSQSESPTEYKFFKGKSKVRIIFIYITESHLSQI